MEREDHNGTDMEDKDLEELVDREAVLSAIRNFGASQSGAMRPNLECSVLPVFANKAFQRFGYHSQVRIMLTSGLLVTGVAATGPNFTVRNFEACKSKGQIS